MGQQRLVCCKVAISVCLSLAVSHQANAWEFPKNPKSESECRPLGWLSTDDGIAYSAQRRNQTNSFDVQFDACNAKFNLFSSSHSACYSETTKARSAYWEERDAYFKRETARFDAALDFCYATASANEKAQRSALTEAGRSKRESFSPLDLLDRGRTLRDGAEVIDNLGKLIDPQSRGEVGGNLANTAMREGRSSLAERTYNPNGVSNQKIDDLTSGARELNEQINRGRGVGSVATEVADTSLAAVGASANSAIEKLDKRFEAIDNDGSRANNMAKAPGASSGASIQGQTQQEPQAPPAATTLVPLRRTISPTDAGAGVVTAATRERLQEEAAAQRAT